MLKIPLFETAAVRSKQPVDGCTVVAEGSLKSGVGSIARFDLGCQGQGYLLPFAVDRTLDGSVVILLPDRSRRRIGPDRIRRLGLEIGRIPADSVKPLELTIIFDKELGKLNEDRAYLRIRLRSYAQQQAAFQGTHAVFPVIDRKRRKGRDPEIVSEYPAGLLICVKTGNDDR